MVKVLRWLSLIRLKLPAMLQTKRNGRLSFRLVTPLSTVANGVSLALFVSNNSG